MTPGWGWRVDARAEGHRFGWKLLVNKLNREKASAAADQYALDHPLWQIRLVDDASGEVVHIAKASAA